jgi:hypothetical protein
MIHQLDGPFDRLEGREEREKVTEVEEIVFIGELIASIRRQQAVENSTKLQNCPTPWAD